MSDALSIGVSGLLAFQQALDVTSNNISNSATAGYSEEQVNLSPSYAQPTGTGYLGSGVSVASITRNYSEILAGQVRSSQSSYSGFSTLATQATNVDNMLSASTTGLTDSLTAFSNALQELATAPSQTASGQALISQAQALVQQFQNYNTQLSQYSAAVESQVGTTIPQVNTLASQIASLNQQIARAGSAPGQQPNQLMDQRDTLLNQLSQYVSISTSTQSDGTINVYIGNGQGLVVGGNAQTLAAIASPYDASQSDIGLSGGGGTVVDITSEITGGTLGGLLATRSQVLDPTQNALGQIATGLADTINSLQHSGMTASGTTGSDMFAVGAPQVAAATGNAGNATVSASITDLPGLTTDDYVLSSNGGSWVLTDTTSGQSVPMSGAGTAASPLQAAGLSIVVSGTAAAGDSFQIRPTANAISGMSVLLGNPNQIASGAALQGAAASDASGNPVNAGTGAIAAVTVPAGSTPNLDPVTITFTSATSYTLTDNATGATTTGTYSAGQSISFNGWSTSITGVPAAGDSFTVGSNAGNTGDGSNLFAMIDALSSNTLDASTAYRNGTTSLTGAANALVSGIGVLTQQAQANSSAQQAVNQAANDSLSNLSGVNLDQEAANMVRYQQAYQAAAQVIQSSNTMFNSLMSALQNG